MARPITTEISTLGDLLLRSAADHPGRLAIVMPEARATFAELRDGALRVARALLGLGLRPGQRIALLIPNSIAFAEGIFGIALCGCVAVPLNARHRAGELGYIIGNADVAAILTSRDPADPVDFLAILDQALALPSTAPGRPHMVVLRGEGQGDAIGRASFLQRAKAVDGDAIEHIRRGVRVRDPALILYTSGTTAHPKGCVLTHEAVTRGPVERARYRLSCGGLDVTWAAGQLFHIGSLSPFVGSVGAAGTFLCDSWFEPGRAIALMEEHGATLAWPWFSAIAQGIIDHPGFAATRFASLRHLFLIAHPTLVERVQALLPRCEVIQACGMTETAGIFALSDPQEDRHSRSTTHGKPYAGVDVRIVDPDTGADQPDGRMGEILVRGFNVMEGYWAAPEKTHEALDEAGWLRSGDLYTRLPGGSLVFGGRCKDMLKVGGENVAAIEVEAFLCTHPAVKTAEVVGRHDLRLDEVPVAFVELYAGHDADAETLIAHCRGRIASYKVPRAIHFMAGGDWPMSATKIDKRALRERLA